MQFDKQEKINADKAIAYFMGWRIDNSFPDKDKVWRSPKGDIELETTFKWSEDWNKLMEVYSAVNDLEDYYIEISTSGICCITYYEASKEDVKWTTYDMGSMDLADSIYITLAKFIVYYNESQIKK